MKFKKVMYVVVSSAFAVSAMFFTGNTVKAVTEKVERESHQQLVLQQAGDTFSSDLLAHSSHSSHRSHSSHSSHRSHYSSR